MKQRGEFRLDNERPGSVAFSPDGRLLAAGFWLSNFVRVWDLASGRQVAQVSPGYVYRVQFTPDGTRLAAGSGQAVQLWDVATWQSAGAFTGYTAEVLSFAFAPDGRTLAVGAADGTLCLWDATQKRQLGTPPLSPTWGRHRIGLPTGQPEGWGTGLGGARRRSHA